MDQQISKHLPAILALAHDRSEDGRVALAEKLAEVFLSQAAALTANEEKLVNELIEEILKHENPRVRQAFIEQFAKAIHASRDIAKNIVNGPIELARTVLVSNENFLDEDLIIVVQTKSRDHATAVAMRREVSEAVADALVTTGDLNVMQIVAENMGAKLSSRAVDVLVDAARMASMLQKPLLARPELKEDSAIRLFWWVTQDLRRAALDRFGFGPGRLDAALDKAIEEKLASRVLYKEDDKIMGYLADWMEERGAVTIKILPQLLRAGHYRLFNILLARLGHLEVSVVDLIAQSAGGRYMVPLCRAVNIDKGNFVSIFLMSRGGRHDEQVVHPHELSAALAAFDRLSVDTALTMLNAWRADPSDLFRRMDEPVCLEA